MLYYGNAMFNFVFYMLYYGNAMFNLVFYMLYYDNLLTTDGESIYESANIPNAYLQFVGIFYYTIHEKVVC